MAENYLPLNRKVFKHKLWQEKRTFSRFEAWLDLLALARFENDKKSVIIKGQDVSFGRGELPGSLRFFMPRWGWSKGKVDTFFKLLRSSDMIKTRTVENTTQTVITICKYEDYNNGSINNNDKKGQSQDSKRTVEGQSKDKTNKENIEKKDNINVDFLVFWDLYGKKVGSREKCKSKWDKLDFETQVKILDTLPNWKKNYSDIQYLPFPETYINQKRWEDEVQQKIIPIRSVSI